MSKQRWDDLNDLEKCERWWRSLDAGTRLVFIQALWETQGEPRAGQTYGAIYAAEAVTA